MATHFSILAWEIPWTEGLVGYSPRGLKRVRHNLATEHASTKSVGFLTVYIDILSSAVLLTSNMTVQVTELSGPQFPLL